MSSKFCFSSDSKKGVEGNVTKRSGHGKWITKIIQTDPIEFDMFRFDNIDDYRGIRAPISIHEESIQPTTIVVIYFFCTNRFGC